MKNNLLLDILKLLIYNNNKIIKLLKDMINLLILLNFIKKEI